MRFTVKALWWSRLCSSCSGLRQVCFEKIWECIIILWRFFQTKMAWRWVRNVRTVSLQSLCI